MRLILLLTVCLLPLFSADELKVDPTVPYAVQGTVDKVTGKIEILTIWDVNYAFDAVGNKVSIGERAKTVKRSDAPALFAALDTEMAKTAARDTAEKAKKAAAVGP